VDRRVRTTSAKTQKVTSTHLRIERVGADLAMIAQ
jgi:hypothetical protein